MDPFRDAANLKSSEKTQSNEVYSVTEYIALVNIRLKPLRATIQGEIAEVKYSQKAVYFNLRDKGGATISCLVWLSRLASLGIDPKDGMEVKVQGYPDVYPQYGKLTFKVDVITPVGEGALRLAFEKLKKDLQAQGYFRPERKRSIPGHIERMGLITSETGVVHRDFLRGLGNHGITIYFYDTRVEGLHAIESIVTAIQWFNQNASDVEALVIARGGGSLEQLQPFNTIEVAKAIHGSRIPVMTAIGHELDVTIADLVADVRAPVPMDAGKRLADTWEKAEAQVDTIEKNVLSAFRSRCREFENKIAQYSENIVSNYTKTLSQNKQQIASHREDMMRCFRDVLTRVRGVEENFLYNFERFSNGFAVQKTQVAGSERILHREAERAYTRLESHLASVEEQYRNSGTRFDRYLRSLGADISELDVHIRRNGRRWYTALGHKVTDCEAVLAANDPRLKLKQGFSIIKDRSGRVVRSRKMVAISDIIQVELYDGVLDTKVDNIR